MRGRVNIFSGLVFLCSLTSLISCENLKGDAIITDDNNNNDHRHIIIIIIIINIIIWRGQPLLEWVLQERSSLETRFQRFSYFMWNKLWINASESYHLCQSEILRMVVISLQSTVLWSERRLVLLTGFSWETQSSPADLHNQPPN